MLGSFGPIVLYSLAKTEFNPHLIKRILTLPFLTLIGIGISINCTWGIVTGFSSKSGVFERTPKYNLVDSKATWASNAYSLPISPITAVEILMGSYILASSMWLYREHGFGFPYWEVASAAAYFLVAGASLWQSAHRAILISKREIASINQRIELSEKVEKKISTFLFSSIFVRLFLNEFTGYEG
jgi:hypothetical protein